jgi:hypothetical protein
MLRTLTLAMFLAACGGKSTGPKAAPATHAQGEHGEHGEGDEGKEAEAMSPEMKRFHDLLHPRWSMPAGPERQKSTCDAIDQLLDATKAIGKSTPPQSTNADSWTAGTRALAKAMLELKMACSNGKSFDATFQAVHDAFHALMMQGEHGEGGGGGSRDKGEHAHGEGK